MTFRPIPKDAPLRERLQAQVGYFQKEMEIPVPIKVFYGDVESILAQVLLEYGIRNKAPEYYEDVGVWVPTVFPPEAPFIMLIEEHARKIQNRMNLVHHEVAHIKDLRYSDDENIIVLTEEERESRFAKEMGFKTLMVSELSGWPLRVVRDYYERLMDHLADTRPTIEVVKKDIDAAYEADTSSAVRQIRYWKICKMLPSSYAVT